MPFADLPALALAGLALGATFPAGPAGAPTRSMAVTVDDLPATQSGDVAEMRRITDGVLAALDFLRGEPGIRELLDARGRKPRWFRHPFTHTGPTREVRRAFEAFLAERGYAVAPFTIENVDYVFDLGRRTASGRGDHATVERLRAAYVDYTVSVTKEMEALSRRTFGREVPQVLLIHANATNADALDEALGRLAGRGYRFVTLAEALADEAWRTPDEYVGPRGPSWLFRLRVAMGLPLGLEREPDPPKWVLDLYREGQR